MAHPEWQRLMPCLIEESNHKRHGGGPDNMTGSNTCIRWFSELTLDDVPLVGGKNASLGEMYRGLKGEGINVPDGFAITATAYRELLESAGIGEQLATLLDGLDTDDAAELARRGRRARDLILSAPIPEGMRTGILEAFHRLIDEYGPDTSVAVRSSATAEDLPTASFAGQQESFLNITSDESLIDACRHCFSSLYTDRAIHYRLDQGFDHTRVALSIGVQKMVRSDLESSGVIFTLDTESGFRDVVFITGAWGLGENVVQGTVDPDEFYVHKPTYEAGNQAVLRRHLGEKQIKMIYARGRHGATTRNIPTPRAERQRFCLSDREVLTLAGYAMKIEAYYSRRHGRDTPMDIEWAKDGKDGGLYIVQARPETVISQRQAGILREYELTGKGELLVQGHAVGEKIAAGVVRAVHDPSELPEFRAGEVLVTDITTPDWEPVMKQAAAIVTNRGGRTCHAAIVARELGIPAVVGTGNAVEKLASGVTVTVSCAEGATGHVYAGELPFRINETDLGELRRPKTRIMVNLGNPELAFRTAQIPSDGVGLARLEFIITEYIKAHPLALLAIEKVTDPGARAQLEALTAGYASPAAYFIEKLSEGVGTIAAAFYPRPVVVRLSDFKSNEYASLLGGVDFEPVEANPMLGLRGASRYVHPDYREAFALECAAMKRVREEMGFRNVKLMVPFCRTLGEAGRVLKVMAEHGLQRGVAGLEIYMMCELPNNVMLIDEFSEYFDGFSIGSNDLTQLSLGIDRDSELVAAEFDERDPGVRKLLRLAVEGARRNHRHSGICGQAPSDYPDMATFLVELGIDSISLNPDTVMKTTQHILAVEQKLAG
jgi:pyruvate,water dikinase